MPIVLFKSIGGYCSHLDKEHEIKIHFQKKHPIGQAHAVLVPTVFECSHANKCQQGNECPIWKQACKISI